MRLHLLFPGTALLLLAVVMTANARSSGDLCNHKVCDVNNRCVIATNGPDTNCLDFAPTGWCNWITCNET